MAYLDRIIDSDSIQERHAWLSLHLDERTRRLAAATEAVAAGYGGIAAVSRATGIAVSMIGRGKKDLAGETPLEPGRIDDCKHGAMIASTGSLIVSMTLAPFSQSVSRIPR